MDRSFITMMEHLKHFDLRKGVTSCDVQGFEETNSRLRSEALLIDDFTGLQNSRAFDDCQMHRPFMLEIDIRSLWDINKQCGRDVGDWVMGVVVDHIWRHWAYAYRLFADKFLVEFKEESDARQFAAWLVAQLK